MMLQSCLPKWKNQTPVSIKEVIEKNLSIEYGFPNGTHLMGILRIHLKIYLPECWFFQTENTWMTIVYKRIDLECSGHDKRAWPPCKFWISGINLPHFSFLRPPFSGGCWLASLIVWDDHSMSLLSNTSLSHLIGLPSFPFCSHNKVIMFLDFIRNEYTFSQTPFCQCSSIILCIPLILYANHKTLHILYPCHVKYMVEMFWK